MVLELLISTLKKATYFYCPQFRIINLPCQNENAKLGSNSNFLKKGVKKIKFEKGVPFGNFRKMGASRPINGREAWGRRPPAHPMGGRSENFSQALPEGFFANKKLFLFA
jgi:hypothetical protein